MAEYSYSQLSQMQKEAAERVMEMRRRAKFAAEDAAKQLEAQKQKNEPHPQPQQGAEKSADAQKGRPCCKRQMCQREPAVPLFVSKGAQTEDADRALIFSLCFLLQAEKADEELILAMLYILT